ncbi:hypothetical protein [Luethyella okanaganae]|uniref:Cyclic nucleotide-binding domain-containing protein n=1 Tax=Luethyella okanaganae TaxID=69372 RepID=A0ABW1VAN5_9MICO
MSTPTLTLSPRDRRSLRELILYARTSECGGDGESLISAQSIVLSDGRRAVIEEWLPGTFLYSGDESAYLVLSGRASVVYGDDGAVEYLLAGRSGRLMGGPAFCSVSEAMRLVRIVERRESECGEDDE